MLKALAGVLAAVASLGVATPAFAARPYANWATIQALLEKVELTGTNVTMMPCEKFGVMGWYRLNTEVEPNIDELRVCTNSTDMTDPMEVWEVVVHESTHVMQACFGETIVNEEAYPELLAELQVKSPSTVRLLQEGYAPEDYELELEAFWMEFQEPSFALEMMDRYCGEYYR